MKKKFLVACITLICTGVLSACGLVDASPANVGGSSNGNEQAVELNTNVNNSNTNSNANPDQLVTNSGSTNVSESADNDSSSSESFDNSMELDDSDNTNGVSGIIGDAAFEDKTGSGKSKIVTEAGCIVDDQAGLFNSEERDELIAYVDIMSQFGPFALVTISENNYNSTKEYAKNYYKYNFASDTGVILLLDMKNRNVMVYTLGFYKDYIDDQKCVDIVALVAPYASNGEYYTAAVQGIKAIAHHMGCDQLDVNYSYGEGGF